MAKISEFFNKEIVGHWNVGEVLFGMAAVTTLGVGLAHMATDTSHFHDALEDQKHTTNTIQQDNAQNIDTTKLIATKAALPKI